MNHDAELDLLHAHAEHLAAAQWPLIIAMGLAALGVIGMVVSSPMLGIVGWFGGFLVGLYAISRGAAAAALSPLVKYPAMLGTFVPGLALIATVAVWWMSRQAASACSAAIERTQRSARLAARPSPAAAPAAPRPAPMAAAASTSRKPTPELALPAVRGVLDPAVPEGTEIRMTAGFPRPEGMSDADYALILNASGPSTRATLGHFLAIYRMDAGETWQYVNETDREQSGLTRDGLHRKAMQNLTALVKRPGLLRQIENPPYMGFLLDGENESSLVLVDDVWKSVLRNDCPNGAVVVIPARDVCAFCDADSPEGIIALREIAAKFRDQRGFVSDQLLLYTAQGWSIFR